MAFGGHGAGGLRVHFVNGVGAAGGTTGFGGDVERGAEEFAIVGGVRRGLPGFESPGGLGAFNLFEVGDARALLAGGAGFDEIGNRNGGQQGDDGHDDHDFDQGEPRGPDCFNGLDLHLLFLSYTTA